MSAWEAVGKSNEWYTPPAVFAALGMRFAVDVAPARYGVDHVPAERRLRDGLADAWGNGAAWMNAPFEGRNGLIPWLDRFFAHGHGIALTPDRTSAPWFWSAWEQADAVLFTRKLRFLRPDGTEGVAPSCGTALFARGLDCVAALKRAEAAGFGILAAPMVAARETVSAAA